MKKSPHVFSLVLVLVAACDGGTSGGDDAPDASGGGVTCTVTSSITAMMAAKTVTGVGTADCTGSASIKVETCVQWNPSGTFVDIQCMSSTSTGTMLQKDNLASCGITAGRRFRSRVIVTVDGVAKPEMLSADIACF